MSQLDRIPEEFLDEECFGDLSPYGCGFCWYRDLKIDIYGNVYVKMDTKRRKFGPIFFYVTSEMYENPHLSVSSQRSKRGIIVIKNYNGYHL